MLYASSASLFDAKREGSARCQGVQAAAHQHPLCCTQPQDGRAKLRIGHTEHNSWLTSLCDSYKEIGKQKVACKHFTSVRHFTLWVSEDHFKHHRSSYNAGGRSCFARAFGHVLGSSLEGTLEARITRQDGAECNAAQSRPPMWKVVSQLWRHTAESPAQAALLWRQKTSLSVGMHSKATARAELRSF